MAECWELTLAGFVRNIEKECQLNIPSGIIGIIYDYVKVCDAWDGVNSNDSILIDDNLGVITFMGDNRAATAYGQKVVSDGIFVWRIQIMKIRKLERYDRDSYIYVGILENNEDNVRDYVNSAAWDDYGYQLSARKGRIYSEYDWERDATNIECKWEVQGDSLQIILDLNQRTLDFKMNETEFVGFRDIKQSKYRLALTTKDLCGSKFVLL